MQPRQNDLFTRWLPLGVIALATVAAYANSLQGGFLLDDGNCIYQNPSITRFWDSFTPPSSVNIFRRQLVNVSLAVNYAISGLDVWSYHLLNMLIHLGAALALFAILRRMLAGERTGRYAAAAPWLAMASATLWAVHPLQTQAVTYIIQRCESLLGLCLLASVLLAMISMDRARPRPWQAGSVACCLLGVFVKEAIVLAPALILFYDRWFVSDSLKEGLRRHRLLYAGHLACLAVLAFNLGQYVSSDTTAQNFSVLDYALSQPEVILHYLRLAVWPVGLCLDYQWPVSPVARALPFAAVILLCLAGTVLLIRRRSVYGFFLGWFWICLAPSSSFLPINDLAFEHRMYLPLAGLTTLACLAVHDLARLARQRTGVNLTIAALALWATAVAACAMLTFARNMDYAQGELFMWRDVIAKRPENAKAQSLVGKGLAQLNRMDEAIPYYLTAIGLEPDNFFFRNDLALIYEAGGDLDKAEEQLRAMIRLRPEVPLPYIRLSRMLFAQRRQAEGVALLEEAVRANPKLISIRANLAQYYYQTGQYAKAVPHLEAYLEATPDNAAARRMLEQIR
ncbi:tetratricopeptide repeat protein [Pseudodesulfovibrio sp.]|uniref:tetratricopeptide repeat protein n=1 Tax=Pseudodesulfovibrio sp. TaxID=2035812 RepID=UPI0026019509|nr:tetratricopeptide repeat protein [Pseudodesulfovibrio sp.]MDD3312204.1 tetratricopeptide repeat protein [Pseudodesulfovibrio sp.]